MAIKFLRVESETPNIQNTDDCRALRYAFGGRDGVVESYLNVCSYTATSGVFKINSGEIVVQGCQVDIDANGIESTITSLSGTQYYICYLMLNLQTETASIVCSYDTSDYPTIPTSDDLTANPTGTAYLLLYKFTASSGTIGNVVQQFSILYPDGLVRTIWSGNLEEGGRTTLTNSIKSGYKYAFVLAGGYTFEGIAVLFDTSEIEFHCILGDSGVSSVVVYVLSIGYRQTTKMLYHSGCSEARISSNGVEYYKTAQTISSIAISKIVELGRIY